MLLIVSIRRWGLIGGQGIDCGRTLRKADDGDSPLTCGAIVLVGLLLSACGIKYGSIEWLESATCHSRGRRTATHQYGLDCHDRCA
jgi:hypothetical protein